MKIVREYLYENNIKIVREYLYENNIQTDVDMYYAGNKSEIFVFLVKNIECYKSQGHQKDQVRIRDGHMKLQYKMQGR